MFLQGNLQSVFDALYELGVIDPVLDKDWQNAMSDKYQFEDQLRAAVVVVNQRQILSGLHPEVTELIFDLKQFDPKTLEYLAMEVAREFAEYHARKEVH